MEENLIMNRETVTIEGGRNLYNYTFHEESADDRLVAMIETGEIGVIGPFLAQHAGLDLAGALGVARKCGNAEAVAEIERSIGL